MANHYKHIIVAVDGSTEGDYAFRKSLDVRKRNEGSTLYLVNVIDNRAALDGVVVDQVQKQSIRLLLDYKEKAEAEGISNVEVVSEFGSPRTIISRNIAETVEADLIICGATGHNTVERLLIGSVSEAIVRSATCDVLVIRTPE